MATGLTYRSHRPSSTFQSWVWGQPARHHSGHLPFSQLFSDTLPLYCMSWLEPESRLQGSAWGSRSASAAWACGQPKGDRSGHVEPRLGDAGASGVRQAPPSRRPSAPVSMALTPPASPAHIRHCIKEIRPPHVRRRDGRRHTSLLHNWLLSDALSCGAFPCISYFGRRGSWEGSGVGHCHPLTKVTLFWRNLFTVQEPLSWSPLADGHGSVVPGSFTLKA